MFFVSKTPDSLNARPFSLVPFGFSFDLHCFLFFPHPKSGVFQRIMTRFPFFLFLIEQFSTSFPSLLSTPPPVDLHPSFPYEITGLFFWVVVCITSSQFSSLTPTFVGFQSQSCLVESLTLLLRRFPPSPPFFLQLPSKEF